MVVFVDSQETALQRLVLSFRQQAEKEREEYWGLKSRFPLRKSQADCRQGRIRAAGCVRTGGSRLCRSHVGSPPQPSRRSHRGNDGQGDDCRRLLTLWRQIATCPHRVADRRSTSIVSLIAPLIALSAIHWQSVDIWFNCRSTILPRQPSFR